jgi:hypothetical protein
MFMNKEKETNPVDNAPIIENEVEVGEVEDYNTDDNVHVEPISWSSTDGNNQQRSTKWYLVWILIILALAGGSLAANLLFDIWQIWTTVGLAIVIFISLIIVNKQPPQTIEYVLTDTDITINDKTSSLSAFQSFSITNRGNSQTISLIPIKRMSIPYDLIIPTKNAGEIVDILSIHLPMSQTGLNFTDKISSILKF